MKTLLHFFLIFYLGLSTLSAQTNAWINEIHYDNTGSDQGEAIEIVIESPALLSDYQVYLYNGGNGEVYNSKSVDNFTIGATYDNYTVYTWYPSSIQNGSEDGVALSYQGVLVSGQFLSYEGNLTAIDGPANGQTSIDIGVFENSSTAVGESLQLQGTGATYDDFTWVSPANNTFGSININQSFNSSTNTPPFISNVQITPEDPSSSDDVTISTTITDNDGVVNNATLHWGLTSNNLENTVTMSSSTADVYNAQINAQPQGTTVYYIIEAIDDSTNSSVTAEASYTVQDPLSPGAIVITEIMQNPDFASDGSGEYFEVYNNSDAPIDLQGWTIKDEGTNVHEITSSVIVPARGFAVLGNNIDFDTNGGVTIDYEYDTFTLGNGEDEIILLDTNEIEIDRVGYDGGINWPDPTGASMVYIGLPDEDNNAGVLWVKASFIENISTDAGSPGINGKDQYLSDVLLYDGNWSPSAPNTESKANNVLVLSGNLNLSTLHIRSLQVRQDAAIEINATLSLEGSLFNYGDITFKSTASQDGELNTLIENAQIVGDVTVERYFQNIRAYRMVSSAVTTQSSIYENWQENGVENSGFGTHITGGTSDGFDSSINNNPSMFTANQENQSFEPIPNTNATSLDVNDAYLLFVRGDRTIDLTNNESSSETVLRAKGALASGIQVQSYTVNTPGDFIMFGNPYQAAIDVEEVLNNSGTTGIETGAYYFFDPTLAQGDGSGGYVTVDLETNTSPAQYNFLQPGLAAQIATTATTADMVFEENDKATANVVTNMREHFEEVIPHIKIALYTEENLKEGNNMHDAMTVVFDPKYTNDLDQNDIVKLPNFNENLASLVDATQLAVDRRALPLLSDEIQLYSTGYTHSKYVFIVDVINLAQEAYCIDTHTGMQHTLAQGKNNIAFEVDDESSRAPDRFKIIFSENLNNELPDSFEDFKVYPNPIKNDNLNIYSSYLRNQEIHIEIVNVLGQKVFDKTTQFTSYVTQITLGDFKPGVYFLKVNAPEKSFTQRILIK